MLLSDLLDAGGELEITQLAFDTRAVRPGSLFFCVPGFSRDGHDFAAHAIAQGAAAIVVNRPLNLGVPEVVVDDVRSAMALAAARFYGDPSREVAVVGITGTNGKTTTAFMLHDLLKRVDRSCGIIGTVKAVIGGQDQPLERTTPEAIDLQRMLRAMADAGDTICALEVSSHALELARVEHTNFKIALFTNLTQDHLDFHETLEDYFQAKRRLFLADPEVRIANVGDRYGRRLADEFADTVTFALENGSDALSEVNYLATDIVSDLHGTSFKLRSPDGEFDLSLPVHGRFNVANFVGAWAAARALGVPATDLLASLDAITAIPGRFQAVDAGQDFLVVVDYAHTPDSLENVLQTARELTTGRVIVVFGCGGDRDRAKRPKMGEVSDQNADLCIVTTDNPRSEDPPAIISEITAAMSPGTIVEADRAAAIARAIELANAGDVVVIAGKGHEQGQEFANGHKEPFDDVAQAFRALTSLRSTA